MLDPNDVARAWVRSLNLVPIKHVLFALPNTDTPELPVITLLRIGGNMMSPAFKQARFRFDCWGNNKAIAGKLADDLETACTRQQYQPPFMVETWAVDCVDHEQTTERDGATWGKRYEVTSLFTLRLTL